ncbi:hypothetical protein [Streptomyces chilikensis]|uniref:hypothetical protein n=1 Tax=Streptomyces chilikensis TaxID=1194079 RepID=UPI00140862F1|nr:hypothetical protein [Streptomyces chilikensis]
MHTSASLAGTVQRPVRGAAGRRALFLAVLVAGLFGLTLVCGERAQAAEAVTVTVTGDAGRAGADGSRSGSAPGPLTERVLGPAGEAGVPAGADGASAEPVRDLVREPSRTVTDRVVRAAGAPAGAAEEAPSGTRPARPAAPVPSLPPGQQGSPSSVTSPAFGDVTGAPVTHESAAPAAPAASAGRAESPATLPRPGTPPGPERAELPAPPAGDALPDLPALPVLPALPGLRGLPVPHESSEHAALPGLPALSGPPVPTAASVLSALPSLPTPAALPALSALSALPGLPGLPCLPALSAPPALPAVPGAPGGPTPPAVPGDAPAVGPGTTARCAVDAAEQPRDLLPRGSQPVPQERGDGRAATGAVPLPADRTPAGDPSGLPAGTASADNGSPRHGDAHAVTSDARPPLRLRPGAAAGDDAAGTRDRHRDVPVFPG